MGFKFKAGLNLEPDNMWYVLTHVSANVIKFAMYHGSTKNLSIREFGRNICIEYPPLSTSRRWANFSLLVSSGEWRIGSIQKRPRNEAERCRHRSIVRTMDGRALCIPQVNGCLRPHNSWISNIHDHCNALMIPLPLLLNPILPSTGGYYVIYKHILPGGERFFHQISWHLNDTIEASPNNMEGFYVTVVIIKYSPHMEASFAPSEAPMWSDCPFLDRCVYNPGCRFPLPLWQRWVDKRANRYAIAQVPSWIQSNPS